jgi:23S rRNA (adenine2030-N6)-methyltransferase
VLIDPAYEEKHDYERVVQALKDCLQRFPGGTYQLWYPQLTRLEAHDLPGRLKRLPASSWLHVTLRVRTPAADGFGMHGSGVFVINPPWTLQASLQEAMPYLVEVLGLDAGAGFTLESQASCVMPGEIGAMHDYGGLNRAELHGQPGRSASEAPASASARYFRLDP